MNITLVGKHLKLTDAIKEHIEGSIESLSKYNLDIISATAIASSLQNRTKRSSSIEFTFNIKNAHTIVIKQSDDDLYAAIDIAINRAHKALRRLHDKLTDHNNASINEAKQALTPSFTDEDDDIVPMELELYKPQEIAEVLDQLKSSEKQFEVFIDNEDKLRVLFKRQDGRFGLY